MAASDHLQPKQQGTVYDPSQHGFPGQFRQAGK